MFAAKLLGGKGSTVKKVTARVLPVADDLGGFFMGWQRPFPVPGVDESSAPRAQVVGALRRACNPGKPLGPFDTLNDFAPPSVDVGVPVALTFLLGAFLDERAPLGEELLKAGEDLDRDTLELAQRLPEMPGTAKLVDRGQHGPGATLRRGDQ